MYSNESVPHYTHAWQPLWYVVFSFEMLFSWELIILCCWSISETLLEILQSSKCHSGLNSQGAKNSVSLLSLRSHLFTVHKACYTSLHVHMSWRLDVSLNSPSFFHIYCLFLQYITSILATKLAIVSLT